MLLDGALHVALCGAFCHILAFIIELFALAQTYLKLNAAVLEVQADRNERVARLLDNAVKTVDLLFVHQQSAHPNGIAVKNIALLVR